MSIDSRIRRLAALHGKDPDELREAYDQVQDELCAHLNVNRRQLRGIVLKGHAIERALGDDLDRFVAIVKAARQFPEDSPVRKHLLGSPFIRDCMARIREEEGR